MIPREPAPATPTKAAPGPPSSFTARWLAAHGAERAAWYGARVVLGVQAVAALGTTNTGVGEALVALAVLAAVGALMGGWVVDAVGATRAQRWGGACAMAGLLLAIAPTPWAWRAGIALLLAGTALMRPATLASLAGPHAVPRYALAGVVAVLAALGGALACGWAASVDARAGLALAALFAMVAAGVAPAVPHVAPRAVPAIGALACVVAIAWMGTAFALLPRVGLSTGLGIALWLGMLAWLALRAGRAAVGPLLVGVLGWSLVLALGDATQASIASTLAPTALRWSAVIVALPLAAVAVWAVWGPRFDPRVAWGSGGLALAGACAAAWAHPSASAPWATWAVLAGLAVAEALWLPLAQAMLAQQAPADAHGRVFGAWIAGMGLAALPAQGVLRAAERMALPVEALVAVLAIACAFALKPRPLGSL